MWTVELTNSTIEYGWVWTRENRLKANTIARRQAKVFTALLSNSLSNWHCTDTSRLQCTIHTDILIRCHRIRSKTADGGRSEYITEIQWTLTGTHYVEHHTTVSQQSWYGLANVTEDQMGWQHSKLAAMSSVWNDVRAIQPWNNNS